MKRKVQRVRYREKACTELQHWQSTMRSLQFSGSSVVTRQEDYLSCCPQNRNKKS